MKRTSEISLCGVITALSVVIMLLSYFPYFTYAVPAVAGLLMMIPVFELNLKWAAGTYAASALIVLLIAEPESKLLYALLFGYYPVLKALLERIKQPILKWLLKFAVFNAAVLIVYFLCTLLFQLSIEDFGTLGKYGALLFLLAGNIAFVFYDIAVGRMSVLYMLRLHGSISRIFKTGR